MCPNCLLFLKLFNYCLCVLDEFHVHLANANALVYGRGVDRRRGPDGPDGSERGAAMKKISACHDVIIGKRGSAAREKWDFKVQGDQAF